MASVLGIRDFRRLWVALGLSSLGDWLGLLALTALANAYADSYAGKNYAIATVLLLRVLPALVVGPLAGYVADRLDRRTVLIAGDVIRGLLFVSIPLVGTLTWVFVVTVLVELVTVVWGPAKDATMPNLVPADKLEAANQLSLIATYGSAVPAAGIFAGLSLVERLWPDAMGTGAANMALYADGLSFILSGLVIARLRSVPRGAASSTEGVWSAITDGWAYVGRTPVIRGLVIGITGAFLAGGAVVGLARTLVGELGGGDTGFGLLFAAVFTGLGLGMWIGPRGDRRRAFALSLLATGALLLPVALIPSLPVVTIAAVLLGAAAGTAWVTGNTLLGLEVPDELRGRTFAFVGSLTRLAMAAVLALAPLAAAVTGSTTWVVLCAAVLMGVVGTVSYRQLITTQGAHR